MESKQARLILVEDEALLALDMQIMLEDMGYLVVGAAGRLEDALALAETEFDLALLDMNLDGAPIDKVAQRIAERGIPMIFVTGYGPRTLPPGTTAPILDKPCNPDTLRTLLAAVLGARHG